MLTNCVHLLVTFQKLQLNVFHILFYVSSRFDYALY